MFKFYVRFLLSLDIVPMKVILCIRNQEKGVLSKGVSAEPSPAPKRQKVPQAIGLSSTFRTQSATAWRGIPFRKNTLLKEPFFSVPE